MGSNGTRMAPNEPAPRIPPVEKEEVAHIRIDRTDTAEHEHVQGPSGIERPTEGTATHPPAQWGEAYREWGGSATDGGAGS